MDSVCGAVPASRQGGEAIPMTEYSWGMLCHLTALLVYVGIPFGNIIGPLVVWLLKRQQYAFVDIQGKESINFQISMSIYGLIAALLTYILIGWLLLAGLVVANIVLVVIASVRASRGESYRYPFAMRLIK
jgi:uncharacterized Tic20 family protein